jgi:hypothetical protein
MSLVKTAALCAVALTAAAPASAEQSAPPLRLTLPAVALPAASDALRLPPPLDRDAGLVARYMDWLAAETGAPAGLTWPQVTVEPLPKTVRMGFFFPTGDTPDREMRIVLSPRSLDRAAADEQLVVLGELAHELSHYILLMAENGWDTGRESYADAVHHHCDPGFQRLTRGMGEVIWQTYHSNDALRSIDAMVSRACRRDGAMLAAQVREVRRRP